MALIILAYGIGLAALSLIIQRIAPAVANVILITGIAGGGLSMLWGVVALTGQKRRVWAALTLTAVAFVTLSKTVEAWMASTEAESTSLVGRLVLTLMLLMTVGMLIYLLHAERPPASYTTSPPDRDNSRSRGNGAHSNGGRHQSK